MNKVCLLPGTWMDQTSLRRWRRKHVRSPAQTGTHKQCQNLIERSAEHSTKHLKSPKCQRTATAAPYELLLSLQLLSWCCQNMNLASTLSKISKANVSAAAGICSLFFSSMRYVCSASWYELQQLAALICTNTATECCGRLPSWTACTLQSSSSQQR